MCCKAQIPDVLYSTAGMVQPPFACQFPLLWDVKHIFPQVFEDYCFTITHLDFMLSNETKQKNPDVEHLRTRL